MSGQKFRVAGRLVLFLIVLVLGIPILAKTCQLLGRFFMWYCDLLGLS